MRPERVGSGSKGSDTENIEEFFPLVAGTVRNGCGTGFPKTEQFQTEKRRKEETKEENTERNAPCSQSGWGELLRKGLAVTEEQTTTETKRGRVRRLLIDPLTEHGFRKPGNVKTGAHEGFLVKLADALTYMSDHQLETLRDMLRYRGEGKSRDAWPSMATIAAMAETVAPRPLEEHPTILSWFGSARGPKALEEGVLVAEFAFLERRKRPPLNDGDRRAIRDRADEWARQRELMLDRGRRGMSRDGDAQWLRWYDGMERRAMSLLPKGAA